MELSNRQKNVYGAGEGYPSTGVVVGSQVGPTASSSYDHGRSRVDRQAPGRVSAPGEAISNRRETTEEDMEPPRRVTRGSQKIANRSDSVFLAPAIVADAISPMAGRLRTRARSDDKESVALFASRSSLASTVSRGKKRKVMTTTPDVSEELAIQIRTSSAAEVSAELMRHVSEVMRVAMTSSNLKGTYVKALKDAASYITAAWKNEAPTMTGPADSSNIAASRLVETRLSALEEENAALRRELSRTATCALECPRCSGSESDRPPREAASESARLEALERMFEELVPSILRTIEERFGSLLQQQQRAPEARRNTDHSATRRTTQANPSLSREQEGGEWKVVERRGRKNSKKRTAASGEGAKNRATVAAPESGVQQPRKIRTTGAPKSSVALASAAGCDSAEVQVGEIGASRGELGSAWTKCPVAGARRLAQAGKVALGWSIARIVAIPKRPLQCFKCLELGHVRATCTSTVDRGHLCYRCGGSGHRARGCPASAPKCPLCESLGAPAGHRMGGAARTPPRVKRRRLARQPAATITSSSSSGNQGGTVAEAAAVDGRGRPWS